VAENISNVLSKILPQEHNWKIKLLQNWGSIIGHLKDKVRIEKIASNFIVLGVCHPAWAQELQLFSNVLKKKINSVLKEDRIQYIRFKTVTLNDESNSSRKELNFLDRKEGIIPKEEVRLSVKQQKSLKKIKNEELRDFLVQYYGRCSLKDRK